MSNVDGCRRHRRMISLYADGLLPEDKQTELIEHLNGCKSCSTLLNGYTAMTGDLRRLPTAVPDGAFHSDLMDGVQLMSQKSAFSRRILNGAGPSQWLAGFCGAVAAILIFIVTASALAAGANSFRSDKNDSTQTTLVAGINDYVYNLPEDSFNVISTFDLNAADTTDGEFTDTAAAGSTDYLQSTARSSLEIQPAAESQGYGGQVTDLLFAGSENGDYMVKNYWITLETADVTAAMSDIASIGVTVTSSNVYNYDGGNGAALTLNTTGSGGYTVEVLSNLGTVTNLTTNGYSQTQEITDTLSTLTSKKNEYDRLLSYVDRSSDLTGVILLQDRIYEVIGEIDNIEWQLRSMYNNASYPTIYVSMVEKSPDKSTDSLAARLSAAFMDSVDALFETAADVVVAAVGAVAPLAVIALAALIVWLVVYIVKRTWRSGING